MASILQSLNEEWSALAGCPAARRTTVILDGVGRGLAAHLVRDGTSGVTRAFTRLRRKVSGSERIVVLGSRVICRLPGQARPRGRLRGLRKQGPHDAARSDSAGWAARSWSGRWRSRRLRTGTRRLWRRCSPST